MKLQWDTMTDFAKGVLRKLGAVPLDSLLLAEAKCATAEQAYRRMFEDYRRLHDDRGPHVLHNLITLSTEDARIEVTAERFEFVVDLKSSATRIRLSKYHVGSISNFMKREDRFTQHLLYDMINSLVHHRSKELIKEVLALIPQQ